jgi:hypothetical protein
VRVEDMTAAEVRAEREELRQERLLAARTRKEFEDREMKWGEMQREEAREGRAEASGSAVSRHIWHGK